MTNLIDLAACYEGAITVGQGVFVAQNGAHVGALIRTLLEGPLWRGLRSGRFGKVVIWEDLRLLLKFLYMGKFRGLTLPVELCKGLHVAGTSLKIARFLIMLEKLTGRLEFDNLFPSCCWWNWDIFDNSRACFSLNHTQNRISHILICLRIRAGWASRSQLIELGLLLSDFYLA
jgi:hypothetical protein